MAAQSAYLGMQMVIAHILPMEWRADAQAPQVMVKLAQAIADEIMSGKGGRLQQLVFSVALRRRAVS
jgi:hypothetical protein